MTFFPSVVLCEVLCGPLCNQKIRTHTECHREARSYTEKFNLRKSVFIIFVTKLPHQSEFPGFCPDSD